MVETVKKGWKVFWKVGWIVSLFEKFLCFGPWILLGKMVEREGWKRSNINQRVCDSEWGGVIDVKPKRRKGYRFLPSSRGIKWRVLADLQLYRRKP